MDEVQSSGEAKASSNGEVLILNMGVLMLGFVGSMVFVVVQSSLFDCHVELCGHLIDNRIEGRREFRVFIFEVFGPSDYVLIM